MAGRKGQRPPKPRGPGGNGSRRNNNGPLPLDGRWGFKSRGEESLFNLMVRLANDTDDDIIEVSGTELMLECNITESSKNAYIMKLREKGLVITLAKTVEGHHPDTSAGKTRASRFKVNVPENYPRQAYAANRIAGAPEAEAAVPAASLFQMTPAPVNYH